ncbi:MAG: protein translocase subunit SecD, partial [Ignavibacteria bacterium]|nr:protein translocase subunit SecD [Ignavibacteria bacterium]
MKKFRFKIVLIVALIALAIYFLYPTYADYQNTKRIEQAVKEREYVIKQQNPNIPERLLDKELRKLEDSLRNADPSIKKEREKRIKLGLDLQGGMYVVLEVNTLKLLEKIAKNPDDKFYEILKTTNEIVSKTEEPVVTVFANEVNKHGIRLSRYFGEIRDDDNKIITTLQQQAEDAVNRAKEIIRNRIDQYGVSEPTIQVVGHRRIIVELPGIARE